MKQISELLDILIKNQDTLTIGENLSEESENVEVRLVSNNNNDNDNEESNFVDDDNDDDDLGNDYWFVAVNMYVKLVS